MTRNRYHFIDRKDKRRTLCGRITKEFGFCPPTARNVTDDDEIFITNPCYICLEIHTDKRMNYKKMWDKLRVKMVRSHKYKIHYEMLELEQNERVRILKDTSRTKNG